jgi:phenylpropionate dioxygenase-like ring-hydroxylating dioxygenase large terminal subunit
MMTKEENDLLTLVSRGRPGGELLRRYWQPAALSEELAPGGAPLPVRLLGEDLVMFRDDKGEPGLIGIHCSHRGADLSYGRVEDGALRCIYHGWLYDRCGNVVEQPGEPGGGANRNSIRHPAYPCQERGGMIFAYLGPGEPPLLPAYEFLTVSDDHRFVTKIYHECNYLQSNEGNIDPVHLSFLHRNLETAEADRNRRVPGSEVSPNDLYGKDIAPKVDVELTDFGVRIYTIRSIENDKNYLRTSYFIMPNLSAFPGNTAPDGYTVNWHVPIDDTHHWKYVFVFNREKPLAKELVQRGRNELTADYRLVRNKENRYMQDREAMKTLTFSGIGYSFQAQDACVNEGAGGIQDRTAEHLVSSDKAIVAARKLLLKGIQDVQEGRDALHVIRDPKSNHFPHLAILSEVLPSSTDWKMHANKKTQAEEGLPG